MEVDQANDVAAKRGVVTVRDRNSLKKSAVVKQTEQIDSERLIKAIQYLQERPKANQKR
jgi:hypothetical protein